MKYTTLGFKHKTEIGLKGSGLFKQLKGRKFSLEFIERQVHNKIGINNHQFGVIKSSYTLAILTKLVYIYTIIL
jgi:hypothetical protein